MKNFNVIAWLSVV